MRHGWVRQCVITAAVEIAKPPPSPDGPDAASSFRPGNGANDIRCLDATGRSGRKLLLLGV